LEGGVNGAGKYETMVDSLSNHFVFNNYGHIGGFNIRYNYKKINFSVGTGVGNVQFNIEDLRKARNRSANFTNFLPSANFNYQLKKQTRLGFRYNGSTRNPSLQQINPIIDNIDPLNLTVGNPNLGQEFRNNFELYFSDYKVLKSKNIYLSANYSYVNNAITNANTIDKTTGKRINQAVNVNGNYNFNMWSSYGFELFPSFNLSFNFNPSINRFINIVDGQENINDSRNMRFSIGSGYWSDKWINYWFDLSATNNFSKSSINPNNTTRFWNYNTNANIEMKLPKKWYVNFEADIEMYQRTTVFANQRNVVLLNGSVRKSIDKKENWQIQFRVNDILNQNLGINRNISSNFISETTQQSIRRFGMLSLTYNFNKNGAEPKGF
jgi:outer membrane receptor protein involved in Fe transport